MLPTDTLNGITTFVVAARAQSFTDAADHLGISKSAVGKSIARLEGRLGVKLFHRTTRRLALTADGEAYLAACQAALDELAAAETALNPQSHSPSGRLRIDMPIAFGRQIMLPVLLDIARQYPELRYTMTFTDHLVDPVEEGIDLAIRFGEPKDSTGLIARKLTSQRWIICAAPSYLERKGIPHSPEDIRYHDGIVGYRRGQPLSWRLNINDRAERIAPPSTYQISDGEAMIDATIAGLGLCQMPESLFRKHVESGALTSVLGNYTADLVDVFAVWPKVAHLRPKVRLVVDTLVELGRLGRLS